MSRVGLAAAAREWHPGSFALVMATGIVSLAAHLLELDLVAWPLLGLTVAAYVGLWLVLLVRLRAYPARVWQDLTDHARGPGFFTLPAGTCVLGTQMLLVSRRTTLGAGLGVLGVVLWLGLTYAFFGCVAMRRRKPGLEHGLNGGWLLAVVATQALGVLGANLASKQPATDLLLLGSLALYLLGCLLYVVLVAVVVYRLAFVRLVPAEFTPDTGSVWAPPPSLPWPARRSSWRAPAA